MIDFSHSTKERMKEVPGTLFLWMNFGYKKVENKSRTTHVSHSSYSHAVSKSQFFISFSVPTLMFPTSSNSNYTFYCCRLQGRWKKRPACGKPVCGMSCTHSHQLAWARFWFVEHNKNTVYDSFVHSFFLFGFTPTRRSACARQHRMCLIAFD